MPLACKGWSVGEVGCVYACVCPVLRRGVTLKGRNAKGRSLDFRRGSPIRGLGWGREPRQMAGLGKAGWRVGERPRTAGPTSSSLKMGRSELSFFQPETYSEWTCCRIVVVTICLTLNSKTLLSIHRVPGSVLGAGVKHVGPHLWVLGCVCVTGIKSAGTR